MFSSLYNHAEKKEYAEEKNDAEEKCFIHAMKHIQQSLPSCSFYSSRHMQMASYKFSQRTEVQKSCLCSSLNPHLNCPHCRCYCFHRHSPAKNHIMMPQFRPHSFLLAHRNCPLFCSQSFHNHLPAMHESYRHF